MFFNSVHFAIFLPVVFMLYWFVGAKNIRLKNIILLLSSYFFYACWDWRFLFLLIFSTLLDYFTGLQMERTTTKSKKAFWFWLSVIINLGFLAVFKYYNFFIASFTEAISYVGLSLHPTIIKVILPVGISFYTFHGLSYVIDIYKGSIKAEKDFIDYAVFVSFFPLLVAGPIERATHLLPQIKKERSFDAIKAIDGLRQILWGLFKKIVIADQCAEYANMVFNNSSAYSSSDHILGAIFFAIQIYGDFSGYSDIAIGTAKLFGIDLLQNFAFPYFSKNIAAFWRSWHMSLSSWFRDYVYIPLGGSKVGKWKKIRNTFIIFLVSGFWHGANWTFIVWGLLHAIYIMPSIFFNSNRNNMSVVAKGKYLPSVKDTLSILLTFGLTVFAWIFFRAENLTEASKFITVIFTLPSFTDRLVIQSFLIVILLFFFVIEWLGREQRYAIENITLVLPRPMRWVLYYMIAFSIFYYAGAEQQFIYFQF
jgi:alginate O-acetyltransferase complex protein AlgI